MPSTNGPHRRPFSRHAAREEASDLAEGLGDLEDDGALSPQEEEEARTSLTDLDRDDPLWARAEPWSIVQEIGRRYRAALRFYMHWKVIVVFSAIGMVAGVSLTKALPTRYESDTVICFRPGIRAGESEKNDDSLRNLSGAIQELTLSTPVLEGLVREFKLYPETWVGGDVGKAVRQVRESITFEKRTEDAYSIKYAGMSPEEAKQVTERLGQSIDITFRALQDRAQKMNDGFMSQEAELRSAQTEARERALGDFLIAHPTMAQDSDFVKPGALVRADEVVRKAETAVGAAIDKDAQQALESKKKMADVELGRARQLESDARRAYGELSAQYTDKHPEVVAAASKVRIAEADTAKKQAESSEYALKLEKLMQGAPVATTKQADPYLAPDPQQAAGAGVMLNDAGVPMTEQERIEAEAVWQRLMTEVGEARKHQDEVKLEAQIASVKVQATNVGLGARFEVINAAYIPVDPKQPTPRMLGILVIVLFGIIGGSIAVVRAMLDPRVYAGSDVLRTVRVMAVVPIADKPGRIRRFARSMKQRVKGVLYRQIVARLPFGLGQRARP